MYEGLTVNQYERVYNVSKKTDRTIEDLVDEIEWFVENGDYTVEEVIGYFEEDIK